MQFPSSASAQKNPQYRSSLQQTKQLHAAAARMSQLMARQDRTRRRNGGIDSTGVAARATQATKYGSLLRPISRLAILRLSSGFRASTRPTISNVVG